MGVYIGTFLIALSTLALEITLTRLLSVSTWYHLAFFCLATAMLGMTAAAITVFLAPRWFEPARRVRSAANACLAYAIATPVSLFLVCVLPLVLWPDPMSVLLFVFATVVCALPFYLSGIAMAAALTRFGLPPGSIYGADLLGAATGCLVVLAGLAWIDAPTLVLICGAMGAPAALAFAADEPEKTPPATVTVGIITLLLIGANLSVEPRIRPIFVKGKLDTAADYVVDRWNSYSRVIVYPEVVDAPAYWGRSPRAPSDRAIPSHPMNIDGLAGTSMGRFKTESDIAHLRYDVTNIAHYLRPTGPSAVIGVGGGRDVQTAILFGHAPIVGIDVNPVFISLLEGRFRDFAGIGDREDVRLIADDARSYLARSDEHFDLIQMSLIDTWAATGAGAFTLSENALYTVEAWQTILDRLSEDGVFTVSRWYDPDNLGETGRLVSLATATLLERGVAEPADHLAMATSGNVATLIVSASPLTRGEISQLEGLAGRLGYRLPLAPRRPIPHRILREIAGATSLDQLEERVSDEVLNYMPPRDETPYFFNMLRFGSVGISSLSGQGMKAGNLLATGVLSVLVLSLSMLALLTIALPLWLRRAREQVACSGGVRLAAVGYFSLIGAGFMLLQVGLLQRLSVFLGHPVYALGIVLFTLITSAGLGSLATEHLPVLRRPWRQVLPVATVLLIGVLGLGLAALTQSFEASSQPTKIAIAVLAIGPAGFLLGIYFPSGLRLCREDGEDATPWYWGLNGIFGVLASALAVFCSIYSGILTNFVLAAIGYAGAGLALQWLASEADAA